MPLVSIRDITCYYRLEGPDAAPVVMLSHSLGLDHAMWDRQAADLVPHFRVLRYDTRGHGASLAPHGDYSIQQLGQDALALADVLQIDRFAWCGLSLGGMIGQWIAFNAPDRLTALVLANTSPRLSDPSLMETRRRTVLERGMAAIEEMAMARFFSPRFLASNTRDVAWARRTLLATDPIGYAGCCAAIRDMDHVSSLALIRTPTLVISGDQDVPMPWRDHGDRLMRAIAGAQSVLLPAAHISNLERPRAFTAALFDFLAPAEEATLESGFAMRRRVLGDAYVDRAVAGTSPFTREFQELITRFAWGTIWARPGLDTRTRRLLVLATTAALGRWEEFRLHVRTGLDHDLEESDLKEVLLQTALYAGVPAANAAFQIAAEELARRERE
jgi:3-oxoadipate enol-lactonase / 4-carboxymuconolactone decarboxylase